MVFEGGSIGQLRFMWVVKVVTTCYSDNSAVFFR